MKTTFIGDVHGKYPEYQHIVVNENHKGNNTVQVGDFGFKYGILLGVSPMKNLIIPGNHDNYDLIGNYPHFLSTFGSIPGIDSSFYVRGAYSPDSSLRTLGIDLWENEQLSYKELDAAINAYELAKPRIMVTHECPHVFLAGLMEGILIGSPSWTPSKTSIALDEMFERHRPEIWIHGHHHISRKHYIEKCECVSLGELETFTMEL